MKRTVSLSVIVIQIVSILFTTTGCEKSLGDRLTSHTWTYSNSEYGVTSNMTYKNDGTFEMDMTVDYKIRYPESYSDDFADDYYLKNDYVSKTYESGIWTINNNMEMVLKMERMLVNGKEKTLSENPDNSIETLSFISLSDDDITRGLFSMGSSQWYVSERYLVIENIVYE